MDRNAREGQFQSAPGMAEVVLDMADPAVAVMVREALVAECAWALVEDAEAVAVRRPLADTA